MISSATVFIWYPKGSSFGHASMFIGDLSHSALLQDGLMHPDKTLRTECIQNLSRNDYIHKPVNPRYVSWWPEDRLSFPRCKMPSRLAHDLRKDVYEEKREPDCIYTLYGLLEPLMLNCWIQIKEKYSDGNPSFSLIGKNCSTIVSRILKAGGISSHRGIGVFDLHKAVWTPKDIATLCNKMRNAHKATKVKSADYRSKLSAIHWIMVGLR